MTVNETSERIPDVFVFLEHLRSRKFDVPLDDLLTQPGEREPAVVGGENEKAIRERLLSCLEMCTEKLETTNRELIIRYYYGEQRVKIENRGTLAQELGITINALSIRACRIRDKLEACVKQYAAHE